MAQFFALLENLAIVKTLDSFFDRADGCGFWVIGINGVDDELLDASYFLIGEVEKCLVVIAHVVEGVAFGSVVGLTLLLVVEILTCLTLRLGLALCMDSTFSLPARSAMVRATLRMRL